MTKPVRVVILINELLRGGAQRIVLDLVKRVDASRYALTVVCLKHPAGQKKNEPNLLADIAALGIEVISLEGGPRFSLAEGASLYRTLRTLKPDVLHTFLPYAGTLGRVVGRLAGVPGILSTQCNLPVAYSKRVYLIDRITLRLAHAWIAATEGIERSYAGTSVPFTRLAWDAGRRHFTVVAGVDLPAFDERVKRTDRKEVRRTLGIPEDAFLVLMVARLVSWKGPGDLVAAAARLPAHAHIAIVGWGPLEETLRAQAEALGISSRVHLLGARDDVPELLATADAYAQTHARAEDGTIWEGPNTSQMEACAAMLPSVSTAVPLIEALIEDGVTGVLAAPNDPEDIAHAITRLIDNPEDARAMMVRARARVEERYSVLSMARTHEMLYDALTHD